MEAEGNGNTASTTVTNIAKSKRFYSETYFIGRNYIWQMGCEELYCPETNGKLGRKR